MSSVRPPRRLVVFSRVAVAVFWFAGVAVPLLGVLGRSRQLGRALVDSSVVGAAWLTVRQASISVALALLVGIPLGLLCARARGRDASRVDRWLLIPAGVPTVVAATAWVIWLGRSGWLASLDWGYSLKAVVLAHVFYNAPAIALWVAQARRAIPSEVLETSTTLGASRAQTLRWVIWPWLRPAVAAGAAQAFALCSMSFALVLLLGGGPPVETLETLVYSRIRYGSLDLTGAAACATWEIGITLLPWLLLLWVQSRHRGRRRARGDAGRRTSEGLGVWGGVGAVAAAAFVVPYLAVVSGAGSVLLDLDWWSELAGPLGISMRLAVSVGMATLGWAIFAVIALAGMRGWVRALVAGLLALPSGISALVLGLGVWLAYGRWIDPFEGSFAAIVGIQVVLFFPSAFRMLWAVSENGNAGGMEAAVTLGASPWRAFWLVDWPRWRGPAASALAWVMAGAIGEVAAVSLFYSEKLLPASWMVSRWMSQYRFAEARGASLVLLLLSVAVTWGIRSEVWNGGGRRGR